MNAPAVLSLFESQHAGPHSLQHIRRVDDAGLFLAGGHTARTLCERRITGWDLEGPVTLATVAPSTGGVAGPMCPRCGERATALLRELTDPSTRSAETVTVREVDIPGVGTFPVTDGGELTISWDAQGTAKLTFGPTTTPAPSVHYAPALGGIVCPRCDLPVLSPAGYGINGARITYDLAEVTCAPTI